MCGWLCVGLIVYAAARMFVWLFMCAKCVRLFGGVLACLCARVFVFLFACLSMCQCGGVCACFLA